MVDKKELKEQRDRFLAFSFASADLFLEVSEDGVVLFALGAAKSLTGIDHTTLTGKKWLTFFSPEDQTTLIAMFGRALAGQRCGPYHVVMDDTLCGGRHAIITGIKMPGTNNFYVTIGFVSDIMAKLAASIKEDKSFALLDKDSFLIAAEEAINTARTMGQNIDMTLFDIADTQTAKERLGEELWGKFTESITELLCLHSADGYAAAEIEDGRYSVIHDTAVDSNTLWNKITELSKETDPDGKGFEIKTKTVSADLQSLSERETTKALIYTINEFERRGTELSIESLNSSFKTYVSANAQKIHQFKDIISRSTFDFAFQPVMNLGTLDVSHYEILSRFKEEGSTQEWIVFGEDIGMAADFDIAVCDRAINYLLYKAATNRTKFAVNLSGQSMQNEQFFKTLMAKLKMNKDLADRLIFEITESSNIENLEMVNQFVKILQKEGFKVCLDDFGAGSASFQYIQQLHVDYVKIDGQYTRTILTSDRDSLMVKNITKMCKDLKIGVIIEKIETAEQLEHMKKLKISMGQGYYFAHPSAQPHYDTSQIKSA